MLKIRFPRLRLWGHYSTCTADPCKGVGRGGGVEKAKKLTERSRPTSKTGTKVHFHFYNLERQSIELSISQYTV